MRDGPRLQSLLDEHRMLLLRGVPTNPGLQLRLSHQLGRLVANTAHSSTRFGLAPEMRTESSRAHPDTGVRHLDAYSVHWHSDLSWAGVPSDYTVLLAVGAEGTSESTAIADTRAGYATLPAAYRERIANWRACHHVQRSRALRHPAGETDNSLQPASTGHRWQDYPRMMRPWVVWKYRSAAPQSGGSGGSLHRVVQQDKASGKPYVYLGDHAYALQGFTEAEGLAEVDRLNRQITEHEHVYQHEWRPGDLLIFNNRSLLHRRERNVNARGWRTLRRTLVWRR